MTKEELFPYFGFLYAKQVRPDEYGQVTSVEEWASKVEKDESFLSEIQTAAEQLSEDEWVQFGEAAEAASSEVQHAKQGAKLNRLKKLHSAGKCKCGCKLLKAEKGGKLTCSCGCKLIG